MGEHKSNPAAANNGQPPVSLAEALEMHTRALLAANTRIDTQSKQGVVEVNPAQLMTDVAHIELRVDVLFEVLVSAGLLDGKAVVEHLHKRLIAETEELADMKPEVRSLIQVARGNVPRNG